MPQCQITQFVGNKKQEATDLICQRLRQCAINWYEQDLTNNPLGSTGGVIQADETALGNAKYHKGSALKRECNWVVGGIDSLTGRMAVEQVQKRDADTLLRFLQGVCAPGATIYTDCWKSYNCLQDNGFPHQTVNHSVQFVNTLPDGTKVHTQKIESTWRPMKLFLHCMNFNHREYTDEYVKTYAAFHNAGKSLEHKFKFIQLF